MGMQLPIPISNYYEYDSNSSAATPECFTEDAVVIDEGKTYVGRENIHNWKKNSSKKYTYTAEPFAIEENGGTVIITAHLVGNFPGSPIDLRYFFGLREDKIASLEIKL